MSKTTSIQISLSVIQDASALSALVNSGYRGEESKKGWTTEADLLGGQRIDVPRLEELLRQPNTVILKALSGEGLWGCVLLEKQNEKCYLGMLTVSPLLQNKGLGKALLRASEDFARETFHCQYIHMNVISSRTELISWYERAGYTLTGETRPFPMHDTRFGIPKVSHIEFVVLQKSLT
jgi:ribosomal protein S18 acetylase RimI-like enzyme